MSPHSSLNRLLPLAHTSHPPLSSRTSILLCPSLCPPLTSRTSPSIACAACSHNRFLLMPVSTVPSRRSTTSASAYLLGFPLLVLHSALCTTSLPSAHHFPGHARAAALINTMALARNARPLPCDTETVGLVIIICLRCAPLLSTNFLRENGPPTSCFSFASLALDHLASGKLSSSCSGVLVPPVRAPQHLID